MAKSINFNTIISYIAMNKNAESEKLADEIAALPLALREAGESQGQSVILARLIRGLSCETWETARQAYALNQWHAFPVESYADNEEDFYCGSNPDFMVTPFREVAGALTQDMFARLLNRELMRLDRNGGCLSLVSVALADRDGIAIALGKGSVEKLEDILGSILLSQLEACDSVGVLKRGQYICSLPGIGQLAARDFAEKYKIAFIEAARPYFPSGGISAGRGGELRYWHS